MSKPKKPTPSPAPSAISAEANNPFHPMLPGDAEAIVSVLTNAPLQRGMPEAEARGQMIRRFVAFVNAKVAKPVTEKPDETPES